jgi:hypothetical protein
VRLTAPKDQSVSADMFRTAPGKGQYTCGWAMMPLLRIGLFYPFGWLKHVRVEPHSAGAQWILVL